MEPAAEGPAVGARAVGARAPDAATPLRVIFVDPKLQRFLQVPIPDSFRSSSLMFFEGIGSTWDLFGQMKVDLEWPAEWVAVRADFDRVAADFHRCVQRGPHPPEQGTLFDTVNS